MIVGMTQPLTRPILSSLSDAISAVFSGFNPRNLFAANEPGYLYDLDDLSTVFLDSAMTTPATVNGLVGAVMDKSPNAKHKTQATTGSKPILRGTPTGANLASGASWTAGAGWSIAGDTATATTSSGTLTAASIAAVVGKHYRVTYTITRTAGSIQPTLGGRTGTARSASGTYVQYFDNATSTAALVFTGTGFTGTVTLNTIEAVDISDGSVAAPYALQFEVDDFLQTASVDFSATDKVTVCHGVRKLSDAAAGYPVNTGNGLVVGTFYLAVPAASAGQVAFYARGSVEPGNTALTGNYPAPITQVITAQADISGDSRNVRINGTSIVTSASDLGTGNFANLPIYFGRMLGASGPYNGLEFSSICIGRLLTASELANTERWVARKTGVTL